MPRLQVDGKRTRALPSPLVAQMSDEEEDTCMSYEDEDTCMSYMHVIGEGGYLVAQACRGIEDTQHGYETVCATRLAVNVGAASAHLVHSEVHVRHT